MSQGPAVWRAGESRDVLVFSVTHPPVFGSEPQCIQLSSCRTETGQGWSVGVQYYTGQKEQEGRKTNAETRAPRVRACVEGQAPANWLCFHRRPHVGSRNSLTPFAPLRCDLLDNNPVCSRSPRGRPARRPAGRFPSAGAEQPARGRALAGKASCSTSPLPTLPRSRLEEVLRPSETSSCVSHPGIWAESSRAGKTACPAPLSRDLVPVRGISACVMRTPRV